MGAFCSCLQADHSDHHGNNTSSAFRNCMCLGCFTQQLINAYTVLFRGGEVHAVSQAIEATPVDSTESSFDTYCSPPRPLAYDDPRFSPRFSPPVCDLFALRRDTSSQSPEESEPLRANDDVEMETPSTIDKSSKTNYDTKMKRCSSAYGGRLPPTKEHESYFTYFSPSAEDEDVCPTCLEDYTSENPRIVMQCSHHFHLGCIYEWMERSEACPVCGKKMEFDETT
ncbi:E3 ubiquitin-protein ligase At3g02290-like [Phragmites australis]|uniref:E3 ubiquitin-protein ligase At3g02290-like n=1 Tax=Phragmites australis TaxID=29695 RepID=UPI002D778F5E|nr:E3 ubiquitin-protein ligase At3g02290-like [Phragmites australis]